MKTARLKFLWQRNSARYRGIDFHLTFEEWWELWQASGHWHERGCRKGQYVMARQNDRGPYSLANVEIVLAKVNHQQVPSSIRSANALGNKGFSGRSHTAATKAKISKSLRKHK